MAKEYSRNPQRELDEVTNDSPGLLNLALDVLNQWKPGENYLVTVIAKALVEAHRKGEEGEPLCAAPKTRVRRRPAPTAPVTNRVRRRR